MYFLEVHGREPAPPVAMRTADLAEEALQLIPALLAEHPGCDHVVVLFNTTRLFAVDREGNRTGG